MLHFAVRTESLQVILYLCNRIENCNMVDFLGRTPVHIAAAKSNPKMLKILIAAGGNLNAQSFGGETPLMKAIQFGQNDNAQVLLRFGADSDLKNNENFDSMQVASYHQNQTIVEYIKQYKEIEKKLCFVIYSYMKNFLDNQNQNSMKKFKDYKLVKNLIGYIIP